MRQPGLGRLALTLGTFALGTFALGTFALGIFTLGILAAGATGCGDDGTSGAGGTAGDVADTSSVGSGVVDSGAADSGAADSGAVDSGAVDSAGADSSRAEAGDAANETSSDTVEADADTGPGGVADTEPDAATLPSTLDFAVDARGPLPVGYRSWEYTYTPDGVGEPRTVLLHAWYPAVDGSSGESPVWGGLFEDPHSTVDAEARPPVDGIAYPVQVYSHGNRGFGGTSSDLMSWFASHGWVAIAPDHIGDLLWAYDDSENVAHFLKRPQDIRATLDALEALPAEDPLSAADTSRVVMTGHSRGCYTVWANAGATYDMEAVAAKFPEATEAQLAVFAAGFDDPRIVASVPLAGTYGKSWFGDSGYLAIGDLPVLSLTGSLDGHDGAAAQFDSLDGIDLTWVELEGGCHQTFALGFCDTLDPAEGFQLVDTYVLAFARHHLLGDESAEVLGLLDGSAELSPLATVQVSKP